MLQTVELLAQAIRVSRGRRFVIDGFPRDATQVGLLLYSLSRKNASINCRCRRHCLRRSWLCQKVTQTP
jgi:adenylate kinase family enzyme